MTLKHVLNLFSKTEVQEDREFVIQNDKTHSNPPLEREGASKTVAQNGKPYPIHLSQTILNRLFGRVLKREGELSYYNNAECYPLPLREREELLCERSELSNSGEGCKELPSPNATRHPLPREGNKVLCLASRQNKTHPNPPLKKEGVKVSCAKHIVKDLSSNRPIVLTTSKKAAFTKPSRGTSEARDEFQSTKMLNFRCWNERCRLTRGAAFTLAEVLLTLGIIGVVAAITLPTVINNVNERVNSSRQANIAYKVTQAMDKMKAMGLLNNTYASTDAFVDELQKHLKVAKRCDANHIADCWPTDKVMTGDGEEFEVKNAKTGKNLNIKSNTSNNVGLVLADGSSLILTYNQNSSPIDVGDVAVSEFKNLPVGFGKSKDFAYTTSNTASIDFVMDVNGRKGPNSETKDNKYHDIRSFKAARFAKGCAGVEIPGIGCVVDLGTSYNCISEGPYTNNDNCWAGAKKACADIGMSLPNKGTLYTIYTKKSEYPELPQSGYFWSSSEDSMDGVYDVCFSNGDTGLNDLKDTHDGVLCLGD